MFSRPLEPLLARLLIQTPSWGCFLSNPDGVDQVIPLEIMISCPRIKRLWTRIFKALSDILKTHIETDLIFIVLGAPDSISALIRTERQLLNYGLIKNIFWHSGRTKRFPCLSCGSKNRITPSILKVTWGITYSGLSLYNFPSTIIILIIFYCCMYFPLRPVLSHAMYWAEGRRGVVF